MFTVTMWGKALAFAGLMSFSGCAAQKYTTVARTQDYIMPQLYTVTVAVVSLDAVRNVCTNPEALGCSYWSTPTSAYIWMSDA